MAVDMKKLINAAKQVKTITENDALAKDSAKKTSVGAKKVSSKK